MRALENLVCGTPTKTKRASWLLVGESFFNQKIFSTIRCSGREARLVSIREAWDTLYDPNPNRIICGPTGVVAKLSTKYGFKNWYNEEGLSCSQYYGHWGDYMYNSNYVMYSFGEILRQRETLFQHFQSGRKQIYLRPNHPNRPFVGGLYTDSDLLDLIHHVDKGTMCLISSPKLLPQTFRFVVKDKTALTGCVVYPTQKALYNTKVMEFVEEVAKVRYKELPSIYAMDVTTRCGKYKVVGLNSINTIPWSLCDSARIIEECSKEVEI